MMAFGHAASAWHSVTPWLTAFLVSVLVVLVLIGVWSYLTAGPGAIYLAVVRHPLSGRKVCGYVGKTVRNPQTRWDEHMFGSRSEGPKSWGDTVVCWRVVCRFGRIPSWCLSWLEWVNIRARFPLYNIVWNRRLNPRRIPPWEARRLRVERDAGVFTRRFERRAVRGVWW